MTLCHAARSNHVGNEPELFSLYGKPEACDCCWQGAQLILWPFLQVFQTASEKIETECLAALHALSACLSRSVLSSDSEDLLDSFLSSVLQGS